MKGSQVIAHSCMIACTVLLALVGDGNAQVGDPVTPEDCRWQLVSLRLGCLSQKIIEQQKCSLLPEEEQRECQIAAYHQYNECDREAKRNFVECMAGCSTAVPSVVFED